MTPAQANALAQRGIALHQQGRIDDAIIALTQAARARPEIALYHSLLGTALASRGRMPEAARAFATATARAPNIADHHANLGRALMAMGAMEPAIDAMRAAIRLDGGVATRFRLATALQSALRFAEAEEIYRGILAEEPGHLGARNDLGLALQAQGRREEAMGCFREIIATAPDYAGAHWNLALALLAQGDYPEGWQEYEWRWKGGIPGLNPRSLPRPEWRGEELSGRVILLHAEQGLGDTIQFSRYALPLARRGAKVVMVVQGPLVRLLGTTPGLAQVIASGALLPPFDCHLPLLSVPRVFGTVSSTIPAELPSVAADPAAIEAWRQKLAPLPRPWIGLAWAGDPANTTDRLRSLRTEQLAPLLSLPDISWVSLQKGAAAPVGLFDFTAGLSDFADTAALIANLDLVVSVDTAVAHLAGAMGKPVWILLRANGDWRWGLTGETTPWYPSARLFRQSAAGSWSEVVAEMARNLGS